VELRRLHTAIYYEERSFVVVLDQLKTSGQKIYFAVLDYCTHRRSVNKHLLHCIAKAYSLKGFMGTPFPGVRKVRDAPTPSTPVVDEDQEIVVEQLVDEEKEAVEDLSDDDELAGEIDRIVDYIAAI
jgi:hypothetical protein